MITDADGEQTKSFIISVIEKGETTRVYTHDDKRHSYQEGDYVVFREVEGMTEINDTKPILIKSCNATSFELDLDSRNFNMYNRQGIVENVKVPKTVSYHSWEQSFKNPAGSTQYGMLEPPDLSKFGRSEQLHFALFGITAFVEKNKRYPSSADVKDTIDLARESMKAFHSENDSNLNLEEIDEKVVANAI